MAVNKNTDWEAIRADFATGAYSYMQLAKKYGLSDVGIMKRAKKEEWQKLDKDQSRELIEATKQVSELVSVSGVTNLALTKAIIDLSELRCELENGAMEIAKKNRQMTQEVEKPSELKDCMFTNTKLFETYFKETATSIAINNENSNQLAQVVELPARV